MPKENYLSNLTLLYVEDEIDIREELETFFELRVKTLYVAKDGQEGWELFQEHKPDIVVSDINMPRMNGIEMSEKIKEYDKNVPIVLVTAFSDANYMIKAISAGVDKYVLKPVDIRNLDEQISLIAKNLANTKLSEQLKKDEELIDTLNSFLEFSPNPIIIYEDDKVKFINSKFLELSQKITEINIGDNFDLSSLFQERKGYIKSLDKLRNNQKENKVSVKSEFGRRILNILSDEIRTPTGNTFQMYTFNDITINEYQKLKIQHYNLRLEDFVKHVNTVHVKKHSKSIISDASSSIQEEAKEIQIEKRELSKMEENVLKKSRDGKAFSAAEYASEIDEYIISDIKELSIIEDEVADFLGIYEINKDIESLFPIAESLIKYASVVAQLMEFEDLSFSIKSLADLLIDINIVDMDEMKHRKVEIFLSGFMNDLMNWRMSIFVSHSANDIHYLDASLFSAILQLELLVSEKQAVVAESDDDDDNFELF